MSPGRLAPDAGPFGGVKIGKEFGQVALVFRFAHEAAERVNLAGPATTAGRFHVLNIATGHLDSRCALSELAKVDGQWALVVQLPQRADAVANARRENAEFGPVHGCAARLQFRRRLEADVHMIDGVAGWIEAKLERSFRAPDV